MWYIKESKPLAFWNSFDYPYVGVVKSRRASWSSKPVAGRVAGRGGFDSHPLPL